MKNRNNGAGNTEHRSTEFGAIEQQLIREAESLPIYEFSRFESGTDNRPKAVSYTWPELVKTLEQRRISLHKDGPALCGAAYPEMVERKDGKTITEIDDSKNTSEIKLRPPLRGNRFVQSVSLLILDFDENASLDFIQHVIEENQWQAVIYSTHSHTPEKAKYRVVLPFREPLTGDVYRKAWKQANLLFGEKADKGTHDPARLNYMPSCPKEREHQAVFTVVEGRPLDISTLPELPDSKQFLAHLTRPSATGGHDAYAQTAFNKEIEKLSQTSQNRNDALNTASMKLGHFVGAGRLSESEVINELTQVARAIGLGESETRKTIGSGLSFGKTQPNYIGLPRAAQYVGINGVPLANDAPPVEQGTPLDYQWGELQSLENELLTVHELSPQMIPAALRPWIMDAAYRMSTPVDYIAIPAIVALSSLVGNVIHVRPKQRDNWAVACNLWGGSVGAPSVKKTPTAAEGFRHINRLKAESHEKYLKEREAYEIEVQLDKAVKNGWEEKLKKASKTTTNREELRAIIEAGNKGPEAREPALRSYSFQDSTIEALPDVLDKNSRGILLQRDELMGWIRSLDKQGHEQDRAYFLETWTGKAVNHSCHRVGRGHIIIPHTCISIFGTIQPEPFAKMIRAAASGYEQDGLISRFQLMVYPDVRPYEHVDEYENTEAKNRAYDIFKAFDVLTANDVGAIEEENGEKEKPYLRFNLQGQQFFNEWIIELENCLLREDGLMGQHLSKYRSLMPSLALIFHLIDIVDGQSEAGPITLKAAQLAAAWCEYLESHARRLYSMAVDSATDGAQVLAKKLNVLTDGFTAREVARKQWSGITNTDSAECALDLLEDRGWIKSREEFLADGKRTKTVFYVNPKVRELVSVSCVSQ